MKRGLRLTLSPRNRTRIVLAALTALALVTALWLQQAADARQAAARDRTTAAAWAESAADANSASPEAIAQRFAMQSAGNGRELGWQAGNLDEVIAALRALAATGASPREVRLTRQQASAAGGFTVSAVRAP